MSVIAKLDDASAPPQQGWAQLWAQVAAHMRAQGAHAAHTVILLPYFQLQSVARSSVQAFWPGGFLPRLETTKSWQQRVAVFTPDALDLSFDAALDALRARGWLARAGLQAKQAVLLPLLVEAAQQLGGLAAAVPPQQRAAWAAQMRPVVNPPGLGGDTFASYEAAVARIALEWAAASRYASDALFEPAVQAQVQALVVVRGVQRNALTHSLAQAMQERCLFVDLPSSAEGSLACHAALDADDEAQRAAACVISHVVQGRTPVALPAIDRLATRRISALLAEQGLSIQDETGWKLSTTRAAASLMSLLRAAHPHATQDDLLDWLKHTQAKAHAVARWEQEIRRPNKALAPVNIAWSAIEFIANEDQDQRTPDALLKRLRAARSLSAWLDDVAQALQACGQWQALQADAAGAQVLAALHLQGSTQQAILQSDSSRMSLGDFTQWVQTALEGASFKPSAPPGLAQVVILPLAQLAARPFAAVVMAGVDERHLPAAAEPAGAWSTAQREALGLPSRALLAQEQHTVWQRAMQVPQVDVLWRCAEGEERLSRSPLLQAWLLSHVAVEAADPRVDQQVQAQPVQQPAPRAAFSAGQTMSFSASSYQDVRSCPYRYFALRLLGLQEAQELSEELSKRDFGSWLHAVLSEFHRTRSTQGNAAQDQQALDTCAARLAQEWYEGDAGFIPFAAAWPQLRSSYLLWLAEHEAQGWCFESSELEARLDVQGVQIKGRLDRVDTLARSGASVDAGDAAPTHWVLDYKTESTASLQKRVKEPLEDTQLVFYAALLGQEEVKTAYLGLSEKEAKLVEQGQVQAALPLLLAGLHSDAQRIAQGHSMPALGEGRVCDYCAARGLCRKDFWQPGLPFAPGARS
jgi:ATP-dependent helicase/nuclease subunit B